MDERCHEHAIAIERHRVDMEDMREDVNSVKDVVDRHHKWLAGNGEVGLLEIGRRWKRIEMLAYATLAAVLGRLAYDIVTGWGIV